MKDILNDELKKDKVLAVQFGESVAALLNGVVELARGEAKAEEAAGAAKGKGGKGGKNKAAAAGVAEITKAVADLRVDHDDKKGGVNKKKNKATAPGAIAPPHTSSVVPSLNVFADKTGVLRSVRERAAQKYLYTYPPLDQLLGLGVKADEAGNQVSKEGAAGTADAKFVRGGSDDITRYRLPLLPLIRRVCQLCGIVLAVRDYDFSAPVVFSAQDVLALIPRVKTFESSPDASLPEIQSLLPASSLQLATGDFAGAYDSAGQVRAYFKVGHDCQN